MRPASARRVVDSNVQIGAGPPNIPKNRAIHTSTSSVTSAVHARRSGFGSLGAGSSRAIARGDLAVFESGGDAIEFAASERGARFILVAGKPLGESVARYGPFVMNTPEQIVEAIRDFQSGKF